MPSCPHCGNDVAYDAAVCPTCGKQKPSDASVIGIGIAILCFLFLFPAIVFRWAFVDASFGDAAHGAVESGACWIGSATFWIAIYVALRSIRNSNTTRTRVSTAETSIRRCDACG